MKKYVLVSLGDLLASGCDEKKIISIFEKFSCQLETELEDFLMQRAIEYENKGIGKTFLFFDVEKLQNNEISIMAYYTIGHSTIDITNLSNRQRRRMLGNYPGRDNMKSVSTFLIGQIGRCDKYTSEDLNGDTIFNECYHSLSLAAKIIGGSIVFLECREHMFSKVYEKMHFVKLSDELNEDNLYALYRKVDFAEYWNKSDLVTETNAS